MSEATAVAAENGCPFCKMVMRVVHGREGIEQIGASGVYHFEPLNPVTPGHRLFIPAFHYEDAAEAPSATGTVFEWASYWASAQGGDFNLIVNAGPAASQTVRHLHIHYVPRRPDDGLLLPWSAQHGAVAAIEREAAARATSLLMELNMLAPRFWAKVEIGNDSVCWPWAGATVGFGHGSFHSPAGHTAHRYAWAVANGRLPGDGLVIRHKCDVPVCCNPNHLEEGTQKDNVLDMVQRGGAGYTNEVCRNGHPRDAKNTRITSSGQRRCYACDDLTAQRRKERGNEPTPCPRCDKTYPIHNLKRHLRVMHDETWEIPALRARAAEIREGKNDE